MNRKFVLGVLTSAAVFLAGCTELEVVNQNQPDRARAISSPADVEALIGSSFAQYFRMAHYYEPGNALNVAADHGSSSWGNFGMRDISEEPRKAYDNNPSYRYDEVNKDPWADLYAAIAGASDGLRAIEGGLDIGAGGERNNRARAWGKFVQGVAHCTIGAFFDQGFIVDETTDFDALLESGPAPYADVIAAGAAKLDEAIAIAQANSFTTEEAWLKGNPLTSAEFIETANSYKARCLSNAARPGETPNWGAVLSAVQAGRDEDLTIPGDEAGVDPWWDGIKTLGGSNDGWTRVDMHWIGQADVEGNYQAWVNTPVAQRQAFDVVTPDLRVPAPVDGESAGSEELNTPGFRYRTSIPHPPERGTYHLSHYEAIHFDEYDSSCAFCWFGPFPEMTAVEMDLLEAEALIATGNPGAAAALINNTRVGDGGLSTLTGSGTVPNEPDGTCVPHPRYSTSVGDCGDLSDALTYEWLTNVFQIYAGSGYYYVRRNGLLVSGTPIHLPIPGRELEVLQLDIYTFGGSAGGGAPGGPGNSSVSPSELKSGNLDVLLRRTAYALERLKQREEESRHKLPQLIDR